MNIGIFGLTGSGKSILRKQFETEGFPAEIDINIKNVSFKDFDNQNEMIDFTKRHHCYIAQDASHAGFESYYAFDILILNPSFPKAWLKHLPPDTLYVSSFKEGQFVIFQKNSFGRYDYLNYISLD